MQGDARREDSVSTRTHSNNQHSLEQRMNRFCNDLRSTQSHPHIARTRQSCSKHGQYSTLPSEMRFSLAQVAQMLDSTGNFPQSVSQAMTDARASSQSSGRVRTRKIERESERERAPTEGRKRELMTGRQSLAQ